MNQTEYPAPGWCDTGIAGSASRPVNEGMSDSLQ